MNKHQAILLVVALANLLLVGLFPPYDYVSLARAGAPIFDGFYFVIGDNGARTINSSFLQLVVFVILLNTAIAWLLLKDRPREQGRKRVDWQNVVLFGVGLNLLLVLLFPPMQNYYAVTRAVLPSFDGFYFLFGDFGQRTIVTGILYLEVIIILANGALLYLLFRRDKTGKLTDEEKAALIAQLKR